MFLKFIFLILLLNLCNLSHGGEMASYKLAMQWGFGHCASHNYDCEGCKNNFTIHGLWPVDAAGKVLRAYAEDHSCTKVTPFKATSDNLARHLNPIKADLDYIWPSFHQPNKDFWSWEWYRHGMCSNTPANPVAYFEKGVKLAFKVDLKKILEKHGIQAVNLDYNHVQGIPAQRFYDATKAELGKAPEINCHKRYDSQRRTTYFFLSEILLCYTVNDQLIDCPMGYGDDCYRKPGLQIMYIRWD